MRILGRIGYWTVVVLAVLIALLSMRFLTFNPQMLDAFLRPNLLNHPIPFWVHVTLGPIALVAGAFQFLPVTRRSGWHRWAGRVYVVCVWLAAITALIIAPTTEAGPVAGTAFVILALLWFGTTLVAYLRVVAGRYAEHRRWMIRSYALTCAAITLRIILPSGIAAGFGFEHSYWLAAWGCWSINLVIAELVVRRPARTAVPGNRVTDPRRPGPIRRPAAVL